MMIDSMIYHGKLFHGTNIDAAENIQKYGFCKPNQKGTPAIYFTNKIKFAKMYAIHNRSIEDESLRKQGILIHAKTISPLTLKFLKDGCLHYTVDENIYHGYITSVPEYNAKGHYEIAVFYKNIENISIEKFEQV